MQLMESNKNLRAGGSLAGIMTAAGMLVAGPS